LTRLLRCGLLLLGGLLLTGCVGPSLEHSEYIRNDWGPVFSSYQDARGNQRQRALGPIYEHTVTPEEWKANALRPLFHEWRHDEQQVERQEMLWPVGARRQREDSAYWRFLLIFRWDWDLDDPGSRNRTWIFPFWFQGRSAEGKSYVGFFPFGGTVREFFFWDRIHFALFPLYISSRINEVEAKTWLWPVFSRTEGPGVKRFRIFPFYGYNEREGLGRKTFILWPFWTSVKYTAAGAQGGGWILFPITGHLKLPGQETWWIIPPIFRLTQGEEHYRLFGPWPIVQQEKGEMDKFYLWPLYGRKTIGGVDKRFFLWPLGHYEKLENPTGTKTRFQFFPFYRRYVFEPHEDMEEEDPRDTWTKVWPLYSHHNRRNGEMVRTVFPDLNPMRDGPIERNYGPFWQWVVYHREKEDKDLEIFWGLYRSMDRGPEYRYRSLFPLYSWSREEEGGHVSLLKGLLGWRHENGKKRWRVLYLFEFGGKGKS